VHKAGRVREHDRGRGDRHLIREAGFTPAQRTTEYEILKRY
jgi:2-iminoacetate synthase ThiH